MSTTGNVPGGKRTGGRLKGTPNKATAKTRDEFWRYIRENNKTNPFEFMVDVVHDKKAELALRVQCARELAHYLAPRLRPIDPTTGSAEQRIRVKVILGGADD